MKNRQRWIIHRKTTTTVPSAHHPPRRQCNRKTGVIQQRLGLSTRKIHDPTEASPRSIENHAERVLQKIDGTSVLMAMPEERL